MRSAFISTDYLKKNGFVHGNVEDSVLKPVILRVQDTMVKPILGRSLYDRLKLAVYNTENSLPNGLTADETTLLNDYIAPLMLAASEIRTVVHTTIEIRNKATGKTRDEYLNPVDKEESKFVRDVLRQDFEWYRQEIICYLKDNYLLYPEYYEEGMPGHCFCIATRPDKGISYRNLHFL